MKLIKLMVLLCLFFGLIEVEVFDQKENLRRVKQNCIIKELEGRSNVVISYDDLSLELVRSGKLKELLGEGVKKVTSNQNIFLNALKSGDFDEEILILAKEGKSPEEIYDILYRKIVVEASRVMLPYHEKDPNNYFVSIETNPVNAYDEVKTLNEAIELHSLRDNIDVKVACTPQGLLAVVEALKAGVDCNLTLIFPGLYIAKSKEELPPGIRSFWDIYGERVGLINGYICVAPQWFAVLASVEKGYQDFFQEGTNAQDIPRTVLSVFLSRVTKAVDARLKELLEQGKITQEQFDRLKGKTGMYAAKIIFQIYKSWAQGSEVFKQLTEMGVAPPRVLWASTSAKLEYEDPLVYVEPLQSSPDSPQVINTVPGKTYNVLKEKGKIMPGSIEEGIDEAIAHILELQELGINLNDICEELVRKGVEAFEKAYREAIEYIKGVIGRY
jgi:transaldolase